MADTTTNLILPYILASQAQKHVTHNEAVRLLDGLVQMSVVDRDLTAPPASPADGARYIVATGATGAWAGWDSNVAYWVDGAWMRLIQRTGWLCWLQNEAIYALWNGAAWSTPLGDVTQADLAAGLRILRAPVGSSAEPSISFAGDTDTGLYWSAANVIGFAAAGVARALLSSAAFQIDVPITGTAVQSSATDATAGRLLKAGASATVLSASPALRATYGGTANAITLTTGASLASLPTGLRLRFRAGSANTGATTINVDGIGAVACRTITAVALPAGYIVTGADTVATYDGTYLVLGREIERGSNANGEYVRFADGTQICTRRVSVSLAIDQAFLGGFRCSAQVWTYPAAFVSAPTPSVTPETLTAFAGVINTVGLASYQWFVTAIATQTAATRDVSMLAVGRWF